MLKRFGSPQPIPPSAPTTKPAQPVDEPPKAETMKPEPQAASAPATTTEPVGNKLIVGPNIKLKGSEITDCDVLLVEGRVEASMNSRDMRIAEGGIFSGVAEIDTAEVRGTFEGELIARKRLVIHATGKVSGKIRYGALTVEEGGSLAGDIGSLNATPAIAAVPDSRASTAVETGSGENHPPAKAGFGRGNLRAH